MKKIMTFLKVSIFPLLIFVICGILAWKNYDSGTYLLGWDSIHSEFDFKDAFYRALWGVWREDQGLGAVAIHSHMADLPRIIFTWLVSFVLPQNLVRYSFIFLSMFLGPLGIYYFLKYVFEINAKGWNVKIIAFLGSLYYLLNLGTLQHFIVPFEMFTTQFAFLPWLFLYVLKYLRENKRGNLLIFGIVTLISIPMSYAATLFYAYFISLLLFLFGYFLVSKQKINVIKRSFVLIVSVLLINSFWILPNLYSISTQSEVVSSSQINMLFSPEAFLRNRDYGDVSDVLINRSFLFSWNVYDFESGGYSELMSHWSNHLNNKYVIYIGYFASVIFISGVILSTIKKDKVGLSLLGVIVLSLFFLFNENFIASSLFKYLYDNFGLFSEGFRMPFTKFSLLFIFSTSYYFSYLIFELTKLFNKFSVGKLLNAFICTFVVVGLIVYMYPAFQGNFISRVVKAKLPIEYNQLFNWLKNNDNASRTAVLPLNSLWGWEHNTWKYEGSGFLTFGIKAPLLIRDFDRWSPYNETFYNEASFALYNNNKESFRKVLKKYQVKYLLLDESIISPGNDNEYLKNDQLKKLVASDLGFNQVFNSSFLTVYDTGFESNSFINPLNDFKEVGVDLIYSKYDPIYQKHGDYVITENGIKYPFANFDPRGLVDIKITDSNLEFINNSTNSKVTLEVIEKTKETFESDRGFETAFNCDLMKKGEVYRRLLENSRSYKAENGGVSCDYLVYQDLKYDTAYVMRVKGKNIDGRSLKVYLYNWDSKRVELEELLPVGEFDKYFVIYPRLDVGELPQAESGYTLNIETRSFGRISSENVIEKIEFVPFDIDLIQNLYIEPKSQDLALQYNLGVKNVKKYGTAIYKVDTVGRGLLQLGQGYEDGWIALTINQPLSIYKHNHVRVNSWSNGWLIEAGGEQTPISIWIIFWPQLLQWFGFVLLIITIFSLILLDRRHKN